MTQNSVLSQNWVRCTGCTPNRPWLRACTAPRQCHGAHWRRVMAAPWPCRSLWSALSWPCRRCVTARTRALARLVAAPLGHDTSLYRNTTPCRAPCCACTTPYRSLYRCPYCDTNSAPSHHTIFVSRHSPYPGHTRTRAAACPARRSAVSWPSDGRIVAQARPCRGRVLAVSWPLQLCPAALCHDTIHCIVTQMGSSPFLVSFLHFFFFFSHHFFSHSNYWKTTKEKK